MIHALILLEPNLWKPSPIKDETSALKTVTDEMNFEQKTRFNKWIFINHRELYDFFYVRMLG